MIADWKKDLAKERSLWHVYRESKRLPKSPFNKFLYALAGMAILIVCSGWLMGGELEQSYEATMKVAELGFNLSAQILGFLIGGFAIFATVTDDRLMIKLAQTPMGGQGLSVFKHIFFNFLAVFYIFIATISWSILMQIIGEIHIVDASNLVGIDRKRIFGVLANCLAFSVMTGLVVFSVVRLKSFIWNIYQAFITFLAVSDLMKHENSASD